MLRFEMHVPRHMVFRREAVEEGGDGRLFRARFVMAANRRAGTRFASAFVEELGKWAARLVIAAIVAIMTGYVSLPS